MEKDQGSWVGKIWTGYICAHSFKWHTPVKLTEKATLMQVFEGGEERARHIWKGTSEAFQEE